MNYVKTAMLLAVMTALFMGVGFMIGGQSGMVIAFIVALAMNAFSYWNSDKMVLRMNGAVEIDEASAPEGGGERARAGGNPVRGARAGRPFIKSLIPSTAGSVLARRGVWLPCEVSCGPGSTAREKRRWGNYTGHDAATKGAKWRSE